MSKPASNEKLSALHSAVADAMSNALEAESARIDKTKELYETDLSEMDEGSAKLLADALSLAPSARVDNGLLRVVSAFLKDNEITADPAEGIETQSEMHDRLQQIRGKKRPDRDPFADIPHH